MLNNYLQIVNNILIRLREPEVSSVNDIPYSKFIGVLVNDAKREIEDAYNWNALKTTIIVPTVANQRSYTLTGSAERFKVSLVFNDTEDTTMSVVNGDWLDKQYYLGTVQNAAPMYYSFEGVDTAGDTKVDVWPRPDAVYSLRFNLYVPQQDLTTDATNIKVPAHLVQMLAYANAIAERGEDGGQTFSEAYQKYRLALADAISLEASRYGNDNDWADS